MQWGRLISFTIGIIGGGLLQLWALIMVLNANGYPVEISELLGDGGLFFFATSLVVGSSISLFDYRPIKVGNKDFNITMITLAGILVPVLIYYSTVLSSYSSVQAEYSDALAKYPNLLKSGGIAALQQDPEVIEMLSDERFVNFLAHPKPFQNHIALQLACAFFAIAYWGYTGFRTGMFVRKDDGNS